LRRGAAPLSLHSAPVAKRRNSHEDLHVRIVLRNAGRMCGRASAAALFQRLNPAVSQHGSPEQSANQKTIQRPCRDNARRVLSSSDGSCLIRRETSGSRTGRRLRQRAKFRCAMLGAGPALFVRTERRDWTLPAGRTYDIGRDPQSDIFVDDSRVSWRHAVLRLDGVAWLLEDTGSTNGTFQGPTACNRYDHRCVRSPARPCGGRALLSVL